MANGIPILSPVASTGMPAGLAARSIRCLREAPKTLNTSVTAGATAPSPATTAM